MKSLQESLFDKDLAKKDLKFRDVYDIISRNETFRVVGTPITPMFSLPKVTKYKNPWARDIFPDFAAGLLGIIGDMPAPLEKDFNRGRSGSWCQKAMNILSKYITRSWKYEFDTAFEVYLWEEYINGVDSVTVELALSGGLGKTELIFKRKN